jgi:hypothetical protein
MTFDRWALTDFLTINEAVDYLSAKCGESQDLMNPNRIRSSSLWRAALMRVLPVVCDVPSDTKDNEGRPIPPGLWNVPIAGAAQQQIEYQWRGSGGLPPNNVDGIAGAVIERDGDERALIPENSWAFSAGCVIGITREALDAYAYAAKMLSSELSKEEASSEPTKAEWKDVTITLLPDEQNVQITVHNKVLPVTSYEALGFEDKKRKKAIKAWETFKKLAESESTRIVLPRKKLLAHLKDLDSDGNLSEESWKDEAGDKDRVNIENRIKVINTKLREALESRKFVIPSKPAPLVFDNENHCYEPTPGFRILQK